MEDQIEYETNYKNPFEKFILEHVEKEGFKMTAKYRSMNMSRNSFIYNLKNPLSIKHKTLLDFEKHLKIDMKLLSEKIIETELEFKRLKI